MSNFKKKFNDIEIRNITIMIKKKVEKNTANEQNKVKVKMLIGTGSNLILKRDIRYANRCKNKDCSKQTKIK